MFLIQSWTPLIVTPHVGVWIETFTAPSETPTVSGVWIETAIQQLVTQ